MPAGRIRVLADGSANGVGPHTAAPRYRGGARHPGRRRRRDLRRDGSPATRASASWSLHGAWSRAADPEAHLVVAGRVDGPDPAGPELEAALGVAAAGPPRRSRRRPRPAVVRQRRLRAAEPPRGTSPRRHRGRRRRCAGGRLRLHRRPRDRPGRGDRAGGSPPGRRRARGSARGARRRRRRCVVGSGTPRGTGRWPPTTARASGRPSSRPWPSWWGGRERQPCDVAVGVAEPTEPGRPAAGGARRCSSAGGRSGPAVVPVGRRPRRPRRGLVRPAARADAVQRRHPPRRVRYLRVPHAAASATSRRCCSRHSRSSSSCDRSSTSSWTTRSGRSTPTGCRSTATTCTRTCSGRWRSRSPGCSSASRSSSGSTGAGAGRPPAPTAATHSCRRSGSSRWACSRWPSRRRRSSTSRRRCTSPTTPTSTSTRASAPSYPTPVRLLGGMTTVAFLAYLATNPRRRAVWVATSVYLVASLVSVAAGQRTTFILSLAVVAVYVAYRNANDTPSGNLDLAAGQGRRRRGDAPAPRGDGPHRPDADAAGASHGGRARAAVGDAVLAGREHRGRGLRVRLPRPGPGRHRLVLRPRHRPAGQAAAGDGRSGAGLHLRPDGRARRAERHLRAAAVVARPRRGVPQGAGDGLLVRRRAVGRPVVPRRRARVARPRPRRLGPDARPERVVARAARGAPAHARARAHPAQRLQPVPRRGVHGPDRDRRRGHRGRRRGGVPVGVRTPAHARPRATTPRHAGPPPTSCTGRCVEHEHHVARRAACADPSGGRSAATSSTP